MDDQSLRNKEEEALRGVATRLTANPQTPAPQRAAFNANARQQFDEANRQVSTQPNRGIQNLFSSAPKPAAPAPVAQPPKPAASVSPGYTNTATNMAQQNAQWAAQPYTAPVAKPVAPPAPAPAVNSGSYASQAAYNNAQRALSQPAAPAPVPPRASIANTVPGTTPASSPDSVFTQAQYRMAADPRARLQRDLQSRLPAASAEPQQGANQAGSISEPNSAQLNNAQFNASQRATDGVNSNWLQNLRDQYGVYL